LNSSKVRHSRSGPIPAWAASPRATRGCEAAEAGRAAGEAHATGITAAAACFRPTIRTAGAQRAFFISRSSRPGVVDSNAARLASVTWPSGCRSGFPATGRLVGSNPAKLPRSPSRGSRPAENLKGQYYSLPGNLRNSGWQSRREATQVAGRVKFGLVHAYSVAAACLIDPGLTRGS